MRTKIIYLLLFFALKINAQNTKQNFSFKNKITYDTLYVYDTLRVTDTLRLPVKVAALPALEKCELSYVLLTIPTQENEKFLILNENFAATFSTKRILLSENKNNSFTIKTSDKMKKIGFFGVVFFAFQHLVVAQNNLSLNIGTGGFQLVTQEIPSTFSPGSSKFQTKTSPLFKIGVSASRDFAQHKFSIITGLNYSYLRGTPFTVVSNFRSTQERYLSEGTNYETYNHLWNIPLAIRINALKIFKPTFGLEGYFKASPVMTSPNPYRNIGTGQVEYPKSVVHYWGTSWIAGFDVEISPKLGIRLNYAKGMAVEFGKGQGSFLQTKMNRFEISALYHLARRKKAEIIK